MSKESFSDGEIKKYVSGLAQSRKLNALQKLQLQSSTQMCGVQFSQQISALIRGRAPFLFMQCNQEQRLVSYFKAFSAVFNYNVYVWDSYKGLRRLINAVEYLTLSEQDQHDAIKSHEVTQNAQLKDQEQILQHIIQSSSKKTKSKSIAGSIYLLMDYHRYISARQSTPQIDRRIKYLSQIPSLTSTVIAVGPHYESAPTNDGYLNFVQFPFPSKFQIDKQILSSVDAASAKIPNLNQAYQENKQNIVKSCSGMTIRDTRLSLCKSLVKRKSIDINTILQTKKQAIRKSGILQFVDTDFGFQDVGGLQNLIDWFTRRKIAMSDEAMERHVDSCRGALIIGGPGTGKSLICKAIAKQYNMPLLKMQFGAVFGSLVGQSQKNIKQVIRTAQACAPCVLGTTLISIDGEKTTIQDAFNQASERNCNQISIFDKDGESQQYVVYLDKNKKVMTDGLVNGVLSKLKVNAIIKTKKKQKLFKITTKSGKVLIGTKQHLVMDSNKNMKKLKDFSKGDCILIVSDNNIQGERVYGIEETKKQVETHNKM